MVASERAEAVKAAVHLADNLSSFGDSSNMEGAWWGVGREMMWFPTQFSGHAFSIIVVLLSLLSLTKKLRVVNK